MSADKRRGDARRMRLLRSTCDPKDCSGIPPHGRIYVNVEGGMAMMHADLIRLAEDGYLKLKRSRSAHAFADRCNRSYYQMTPKGWKAKASGVFEK